MTTLLSGKNRSGPRRLRMPLLIVGHGVDDLYQGAVGALAPFFVAAYHWHYAAVSGMTLAATLVSSAAQPLFGIATDRRPKPWMVAAGMALAGAGIGAAGVSSSYWLIWLAIAVSGLGVAAYHPESARLARAASANSHVAMSWFSVGGNVGFALAPLLVAGVIGPLGLTATPLLAIPALGCAAVTALALRGRAGAGSAGGRGGGHAGGAAPDDWRMFTRLTVVIVCRSVITFSLGAFLALSVQHRLHGSKLDGELALVTLYAAGAAGTVLGGRLAQRMPRVRALRAAYAVAVPAVLAVAYAPGALVFVAIVLAAVALYVPFSLHVTLGQDFLPGRIGTASGVTLGLAVSIGGLATPGIGLIADAATLPLALALLTGFAVAAAAVSLTLREPPTPSRAVRTTADGSSDSLPA